MTGWQVRCSVLYLLGFMTLLRSQGALQPAAVQMRNCSGIEPQLSLQNLLWEEDAHVWLQMQQTNWINSCGQKKIRKVQSKRVNRLIFTSRLESSDILNDNES